MFFIPEKILKVTATIVIIICTYLTAEMYGEIQRLIKEMSPSMKPYALLTLYGVLMISGLTIKEPVPIPRTLLS